MVKGFINTEHACFLKTAFGPVHVILIFLVLDFCEAFRFDCDEKLWLPDLSAIIISEDGLCMDCAVCMHMGLCIHIYCHCCSVHQKVPEVMQAANISQLCSVEKLWPTFKSRIQSNLHVQEASRNHQHHINQKFMGLPPGGGIDYLSVSNRYSWSVPG